MKLEHLTFTGEADVDKKLHELLESLPERTITGLNGYSQREVKPIIVKGEFRGLKIDDLSIPTDQISVRVPIDAINTVVTKHDVSFTYHGKDYVVCF